MVHDKSGIGVDDNGGRCVRALDPGRRMFILPRPANFLDRVLVRTLTAGAGNYLGWSTKYFEMICYASIDALKSII
jgi:hypothetical protein